MNNADTFAASIVLAATGKPAGCTGIEITTKRKGRTEAQVQRLLKLDGCDKGYHLANGAGVCVDCGADARETDRRRMAGEPPLGTVHDYKTGDPIRMATAEELAASQAAAELDGGVGAVEIDGEACYVDGTPGPGCEPWDWGSANPEDNPEF